MFTMGLVWTMSSLFGNFENISLCFLLFGGGGGRQMENNPLQKGQQQKQQQQGTNISYHHFLIWTIVVALNFAISGRGAIRPWEVHLLSWGSSTNFWTIQHLCRLYFSMSTVLLKIWLISFTVLKQHVTTLSWFMSQTRSCYKAS
jgi:hypothetical protein